MNMTITAQSPTPPPPPNSTENVLIDIWEDMPHPCQCHDLEFHERDACRDEQLVELIYSNLEYPEEAKAAGIEGLAVVGFVINEKGKMEDIVITRSLGDALDVEVLRVMDIMRKSICWIPGKQRGEYVPVGCTIPVKFRLPIEDE